MTRPPTTRDVEHAPCDSIGDDRDVLMPLLERGLIDRRVRDDLRVLCIPARQAAADRALADTVDLVPAASQALRRLATAAVLFSMSESITRHSNMAVKPDRGSAQGGPGDDDLVDAVVRARDARDIGRDDRLELTGVEVSQAPPAYVVLGGRRSAGRATEPIAGVLHHPPPPRLSPHPASRPRPARGPQLREFGRAGRGLALPGIMPGPHKFPKRLSSCRPMGRASGLSIPYGETSAFAA